MPSTLRAWAQAWCHSNTGAEVVGQPARRGVGVPGAPPELGEVRHGGPRHSAVPHSPRSNSTKGWSTRAVCQSRMPVSRWGGSGVDEQLALVQVAVHEHRVERPGSARAPSGRGRPRRRRARARRRGAMRASRLDRRGSVGTSGGVDARASRRPGARARRTGRASSSTGRSLHELVERDARAGDRAPPPGRRRWPGPRPHRATTGDARAGRAAPRPAGRRRRAAGARPGCGRAGRARRASAVSRTSFDQPVKSASIGSSSPRPSRSRNRARRGGATTARAGCALPSMAPR